MIMPSFQQLNDYGNFSIFLYFLKKIYAFLSSMDALQIGLYPIPLGHNGLV